MSRMRLDRGDLTFAELRLANMLHPHAAPDALYNAVKPVLERMDNATLGKTLAHMVIQADWTAAAKGINIVLAVRNVFATGETPDDLERNRGS